MPSRITSLALRLALLALLLGFAPLAGAEEGPEGDPQPPAAPAAQPEQKPKNIPGGPPPAGVDRTEMQRIGRENMWPAPTAEDWAKPVLIQFQRTWEDAVAVSEETGKPILICINMDGEIASEHYAGKRYRNPETAALYAPYVCVAASVYRHNPRDYDDEGNRILCPRFGSCTCGEHIAMESAIYEKYCEGQRIAPRHICVDLNRDEVFDIFYANDTASIFDTIQHGTENMPAPKPEIVRGDRPILERVASRHIEDRKAVESAYRKGDAQMRKALLDAAGAHSEASQLDLMRLAIFGLDVDLSRQARGALTKAESPRAIELISESMQVPMDASERDALIGTLRRLGESSTLARWLAGVHAGLAAGSGTLDAKAWADAPASTAQTESVPDADQLIAKAEYEAKAAEEDPDDPAPRLAFAEANLALGIEAPRTYPANQRMARIVGRASFEDAIRSAHEAEARGAEGWRVDSVLALASYYTGDLEEAYARAAAAMKTLPPGDASWRSMAVVTVFAEARWKAIKAAVKKKENWPPEWLADLHAAYAVLQKHPLGTEDQVVWHCDFMVWLGAEHKAGLVLREGLDRFWYSHALHQKLRAHMIKRRGVDALEAVYDKLLAEEEDPARIASFAGLASITAAEFHRKARRYAKALASYDHAVADFEIGLAAYEPGKASFDHAIAMALAGKARVLYQMDRAEDSLAALLLSFDRSPDSAGSRDGMGITPGETGQMLLAHLLTLEKPDLVEMLKGALASLDQELLSPDRGLLGPGK